MCGLDEPPEFSLQLWTSLGGKRKNERGEKSDQEEIKDLKAIDFLISHCVFLFWRLLCFNIVDISAFSWKKEAGACTTEKLNLEKTDWMQSSNNNRYTGFI